MSRNGRRNPPRSGKKKQCSDEGESVSALRVAALRVAGDDLGIRDRDRRRALRRWGGEVEGAELDRGRPATQRNSGENQYGSKSCVMASSTRVFDSDRAAKATLALNTALRRVRCCGMNLHCIYTCLNYHLVMLEA